MKIIRDIHNLKEINSHSVISIGNFDGVHTGHQELLFRTYKMGKKHNILSVVICFEPQPLEFLNQKNTCFRITMFREKVQRILSFNIDKILCIKFNNHFASLSAEDFIINVMINKLHVKYIIIGNDFKFGCQRSGDINLLKKFSQIYKFNIIKVASIYKNNIKVSSTNIRKALSEDNIKLASIFLGRQLSTSGKVVHGNALGRILGYPTANIVLKKHFAVNNGVYAVKINCLSNKIFMGISNIGIKPSFNRSQRYRILEVHLFDININLYGKYIEIIFYKKIRNEKIFYSMQQLTNQIKQDIIIVKKYFKMN